MLLVSTINHLPLSGECLETLKPDYLNRGYISNMSRKQKKFQSVKSQPWSKHKFAARDYMLTSSTI